MRLAVGLLLSPGYAPPPEFWLGRPEPKGLEGYLALLQRIQTGAINKVLPPHLQISGFRQITSRQFPTDVARNEICAAVLEGDEDYLLFLDCDMVHPADLTERLLVHEKPVITARYHLKKYPYNPVMYVKHRVKDGPHAYTSIHFGRGVFEVERGGAGALLIRRDVLDKLYQAHGHNWFRYQRGPDAPYDYSVSEDFWFWRIAREAGFSTWADWDVECGHIHYTCVDSSHFDTVIDHQALKAMQAGGAEWERYKSHAVVCGYADGMQMPNGERIEAYTVTAGER